MAGSEGVGSNTAGSSRGRAGDHRSTPTSPTPRQPGPPPPPPNRPGPSALGPNPLGPDSPGLDFPRPTPFGRLRLTALRWLIALGTALSGCADLLPGGRPPLPGHPERLDPHLPPSRVERALWRQLTAGRGPRG
ncbi:DUF6059 family protein [Saccharothrix syringae]|uniref:DUF6059 family protein n=1 Tax=Saccharothrix syringae TaxID=103733 RepID=UPI00389A2E3E